MGASALFELFLVLFAYHAITSFEGVLRTVVPILCLVTVFLFEVLEQILKSSEKTGKIRSSHPENGLKESYYQKYHRTISRCSVTREKNI